MGLFSSEEKKARKAHERALKELAWAFKVSGVAPQQLEGVLNGEEEDEILLTADELVWVRKGIFGGKLIGQIPRRRWNGRGRWSAGGSRSRLASNPGCRARPPRRR